MTKLKNAWKMAHQIGWHPEAYNELHAIAEYIAADSEAYARGVVTRIVEAADALERFPLIGRHSARMG